MRTYRTKLGYRRTTHQGRQEFKELLATLPVITRKGCWHWQCGCGNFDMVEYKDRVYCNTCGRLRYGTLKIGVYYYTLDDIRNCQYCKR